MSIGKAILEVMNEVGYVQKERTQGLNYSYASEAALIAALRPAMIKAGVICYVVELPEVEFGGYLTTKGTAMNITRVHGIVRFEHPESDTHRDVHALGEGADIGDKAGNKAATGMLKYALRQTFLIETGDDPDKDPSEERIIGGSGSAKKAPSKKAKKPTKVGDVIAQDVVTQFWATANKLITQELITRETAQSYVDQNGGDFVGALDQLTLEQFPPEENDE